MKYEAPRYQRNNEKFRSLRKKYQAALAAGGEILSQHFSEMRRLLELEHQHLLLEGGSGYSRALHLTQKLNWVLKKEKFQADSSYRKICNIHRFVSSDRLVE